MSQSQALAGVRVVEMSYAMSAPYAGRVLASQGAEVIKIESRRRPDITRHAPFRQGKPLGAGYADYGAGKLHMALDFRHAEARDLLDELVSVSDVFLENVAQDVVERLHLDYGSMSRVNSRLIVASLPAMGRSGPRRYYRAFGMGVQAYAGINALTGYAGEEPMSPGISYPDYVTGLQGAFAIVAALVERRHSGRGRFVEVALVDAAISVLGSAVLQFSTNGMTPGRQGNQDPHAMPHNTYPCRGEDRWIAIACLTDAHWCSLCATMGRPAWSEEPSFATLLGRLAAREELDSLIATWTRDQDAGELAARLQEVGVPAACVARGDDLVTDPHLLARGYYDRSDYAPYEPLAPYKIFSVPGRFEKTPSVSGRAGGVGADNTYVLATILGKSPGEIAALEAKGVL